MVNCKLLIGAAIISCISYYAAGGQPPVCTMGNATQTLPTCVDFNEFPDARNVSAVRDRPDIPLPSWMNLALANKGQKVAKKYEFSMFLSHFFGLFGIVSFPDGRDVLLWTNTSGFPRGASLRYQATISQILNWYNTINVMDPLFILSIKNTRHIHNASWVAAQTTVEEGNHLNASFGNINPTLTTCLSGPFWQDLVNSNIPAAQRFPSPAHILSPNGSFIPANQMILALTQYAFIGLPFLFPEGVALGASKDELWAFNHFWAVLGWAFGVDDAYNMALQPDFNSQKAFYQDIWEQYWVPAMFNADNYTIPFLEGMLLGLQQVSPVCSPNMMMNLMLKKLFKIPTPLTAGTLSPSDQAMDAFMSLTYTNMVKNNPLLRVTMNFVINLQATYSGLSLYGSNYTSTQWQAQQCFHAAYGMDSLQNS